MKTRKRNEHTAAEVAAQDEDQAAEVETVPGDLSAAADVARLDAAEGRSAAEASRSKAQALMAAARAEAAAIIGQAEASARELGGEADRREREAHHLEERARYMDQAVLRQEQAEEAEQLAAGLTSAREGLLGTIAGLDTRLAELSADRERLDTAVVAARVAGDVALIAESRRQLDATAEAIEALSGRRASEQARADQIGDGSQTRPGQLLDALTKAEAHRKALDEALDELYPRRPGAEHRRNLAELQLTLQANMARIADEARAEPAGPRRFGYASNH